MTRSAAGGNNRQSPGKSSRGDRCIGTVGVDKDTQQDMPSIEVSVFTSREPCRVGWTKYVEGDLGTRQP